MKHTHKVILIIVAIILVGTLMVAFFGHNREGNNKPQNATGQSQQETTMLPSEQITETADSEDKETHHGDSSDTVTEPNPNADGDETTHGSKENTFSETTAPATVPATTPTETSNVDKETTTPETTVPETTVPETTVQETTVPETTAPAYRPNPDAGIVLPDDNLEDITYPDEKSEPNDPETTAPSYTPWPEGGIVLPDDNLED